MAKKHSRKEFVVDQMKRAHRNDAWHGPSLAEIMDGITAQQAAGKPLKNAHSIWELVLHIEAWNRLIEVRIKKKRLEKMTVKLDWPSMPKSKTAATWQRAVNKMHSSMKSLYEFIDKNEESILDRPVVGKPYNVEHMMHGVVQHNLYHTGQIALLKRAITK